jgi:hypothetical protein
LNWLRILDVLALFYLLMSPARIHTLAASRWLRPVEACGKHSLEVFTLSCVVALFGRLVFRTDGVGLENQILVNGVGIAMMCGAGLWLEHGRSTKPRPNLRFWTPLPRH